MRGARAGLDRVPLVEAADEAGAVRILGTGSVLIAAKDLGAPDAAIVRRSQLAGRNTLGSVPGRLEDQGCPRVTGILARRTDDVLVLQLQLKYCIPVRFSNRGLHIGGTHMVDIGHVTRGRPDCTFPSSLATDALWNHVARW